MGNFIKYKRLTKTIEKGDKFGAELELFFDSIVGDGSEIIHYEEHNTNEVKQVQTPTGITDVTKTFVNITVIIGRRQQTQVL